MKGLSAQRLDSVALSAGVGIPHDRAFAIAQGGAGIDTVTPGWQPKRDLFHLARTARLAMLDTDYDEATGVLTIRRGGRQVARGAITTPTGRMLIEQFLAAFLEDDAVGPPKLLAPDGHMFTHVPEPYVSILNRASLTDLERVTQHPVDVRRFRGNLLLEGLSPWAEADLMGATLSIGGQARIRIEELIERCAATEVNPDTGQRDLNIPLALRRGYGHVSCGVYGRVVAGGRIQVGDPVTIEA